jgi:hypothetical protein
MLSDQRRIDVRRKARAIGPGRSAGQRAERAVDVAA